MSTIRERKKSARPAEAIVDRFPYGWRDVRVDLPNGDVDFLQVPLTLEDVLHPQEGDHHVLTKAHILDCMYLLAVFSARLAHDRQLLVLSDTGIYWDDPKLEHHSPDIAVIPGVRRGREGVWPSFSVAIEGTRPSLLIEVVSPNTRVNDVKTKVRQYARAKVPRYVIADISEPEESRRITLIDYRLGARGRYERQPLCPGDRIRLDPPLDLWLGTVFDPEIGGDRLALFDPANDEEIGDYLQVRHALELEIARRVQAERQSRSARRQANQARARARAAEERARAAEERVKQLEEEIRRRNGAG